MATKEEVMTDEKQTRREFAFDHPEGWGGTVLDWFGNNVAFKCACHRVFIVSGFLGGGKRLCPSCKQTEGVVYKGGKTASLSDE
jgi:hypothetical protein